MQKAKKYVMALDQGTTSSRCILFDRSGKVCSVAQKEFAQYYPQPGWVEHNPMEMCIRDRTYPELSAGYVKGTRTEVHGAVHASG